MTFEIPAKLLPIIDSEKRYINLHGGRGSGKSWSVAHFLLIKGMESKKRILCTREVQNSIRDSVHKLLSDLIDNNGYGFHYSIQRDAILGRNGSELIFKGLHRNTNDIKSTEGIDYCWVEEAQSVSRASLEVLVPTVRKDSSKLLYTYNPTNEDDPVHVDYTLLKRPDCLNIEINYMDNPFFPEVLRSEMEWDKTHDMDKYYHVWMGQTVKHSEAQVFYGKWTIEAFESKASMYYFGADWGFSTDPAVLVRCFVRDRKLYIDHEAYGVGVDIDKLPEMFMSIPESTKYPSIADSSRPDTISYVKKNGFPLMKPSKKGPGSIEDGVAFLRSFEKIIIHPRCKHTIYEFRFYSYFTDRLTGAITTKLVDKHNHIIDSLRYAIEPIRHSAGALKVGKTTAYNLGL